MKTHIILKRLGIAVMILAVFIMVKLLSPQISSEKVDQQKQGANSMLPLDVDLDSNMSFNEQINDSNYNSCGAFVLNDNIQSELDRYEEMDARGFYTLKDEDILYATVLNGMQEVTLTIDTNGFSNSMIVLQKGLPATINFKGLVLDYCNHKMLLSQELIELKEGDNIIQITPTEDISFKCWLEIHYGYIALVDDINDIDTSYLRDTFSVYEADIISGLSNY